MVSGVEAHPADDRLASPVLRFPDFGAGVGCPSFASNASKNGAFVKWRRKQASAICVRSRGPVDELFFVDGLNAPRSSARWRGSAHVNPGGAGHDVAVLVHGRRQM